MSCIARPPGFYRRCSRASRTAARADICYYLVDAPGYVLAAEGAYWQAWMVLTHKPDELDRYIG